MFLETDTPMSPLKVLSYFALLNPIIASESFCNLVFETLFTLSVYNPLPDKSKSKILLIHGEKVRDGVDIFDREKIFIDEVLKKIREEFKELKIVLEHVSTSYGVDFVNSNISATYCKLEKYDKALEHAVSATKFRSDWHKAWYRLSFVLHKLDKNEQAKTAMDKTLECCQKENIQESYIEELKKQILLKLNDEDTEDEADYKILDNKSQLPQMPNMPPNMAGLGNEFMPMMNTMMNNSKIKEKLDDFKLNGATI